MKTKLDKMEDLLDELFQLTQIESCRKLSEDETRRYVEITDLLHRNEIEIPFGIEL